MTDSVCKQKSQMDRRIFLRNQQSNRDKVREKFEEAQRKERQELKAKAITKMENVMASIFSRSLRKTAIETLNEIPRPIFNKDIDKYFETDDQSAAWLSSLSDSKVKKTPFKT